MSQRIAVQSLNELQIITTLTNLCLVRKLSPPELMFSGKPEFGQDTITKYNLVKITKFADNYRLYKASSDSHTEYFIIVENKGSFVKEHINACVWFYHIFIKSDPHHDDDPFPKITIMTAFVTTTKIISHVKENIMPCKYRFISMPMIYPRIGSRTQIFGLAYDLELIDYVALPNGREYPLIYDDDIDVLILNGLVGQLVKCKRIFNDGSPFSEYSIRQIIEVRKTLDVIPKSGLCDGTTILAEDTE
jgi:hypothetical protein